MTQQSATTVSETSTASARRAPVRLMLVGGGLPALAATVIAAAVRTVTDGSAGFLGALAGGLLATGFFASGVLALDHMLRAWMPGMALSSALVVYVCQLLVVVALALVLVRLPGLDRRSIGIGGLAAAGAWMIGQIWGFSRSRVLVSDAPLPGETR